MQRLRITNFSCIKTADLETSDLTILIGPQASGKSIISKLLYFFNDIFSSLNTFAEEMLSRKEVSSNLAEKFTKWFPPSAWGIRPFTIKFEAGHVEFVIKRSRSNKAPSERVQVKMDDYIWLHYDRMVAEFESARQEFETTDENTLLAHRAWELAFRIRDKAERSFHKELGNAYIDHQLFVPAGRSFFTSIGKAVPAFEHGGLLDPITMKFGRYFTSVREMWARSRNYEASSSPDEGRASAMMINLFGGALKFERDKEYVETSDGRKIPLSVLSSGQQELLPLWLALAQFARIAQYGPKTQLQNSLIYIEEPEAHLFPSAQSMLLEHLASIVSNERAGRNMLITTHSPYILSKINVLLKAGEIGSAKLNQARVAALVPRTAWLKARTTKAYAIVNGDVVNIMGNDGLIDGEYLDAISGDISQTFNELLGIEYGY